VRKKEEIDHEDSKKKHEAMLYPLLLLRAFLCVFLASWLFSWLFWRCPAAGKLQRGQLRF
jgi:hypothetical protein